MERDLTKYDVVVCKELSPNCMAKDVRCVKINDEILILKTACNKKRYLNEKKIYLKLKDEDFLPELKYIDDKNLILGLSDVGNSFLIYIHKNKQIYNKSLEKFNKEMKKICDILLYKYGLYHNDLKYKNICIDKSNKVRIIDFEWCDTELKGRERKVFLYLKK
jgi:thiamine kinase-like enzyme